jgi:hypothetical protein
MLLDSFEMRRRRLDLMNVESDAATKLDVIKDV